MKDEKQETDVHYKYVMILIHARETVVLLLLSMLPLTSSRSLIILL